MQLALGLSELLGHPLPDRSRTGLGLGQPAFGPFVVLVGLIRASAGGCSASARARARR